MKTLVAIIFFLILQSTLAVTSTEAQIVAVGHISAQVVEAVSVSSNAITGFELSNSTGAEYESLKLGEIKVNSGTNVACNVVLKTATLSNTSGNSFTINPSTNGSLTADPNRTDGNQTLQLTGNARMAQGQPSGLYQGSYTIVFAYN